MPERDNKIAEYSSQLIERYGIAAYLCILDLYFESKPPLVVRNYARDILSRIFGTRDYDLTVLSYIAGYARENEKLIAGLADDLWEDVLNPFFMKEAENVQNR